MYGIGDGDFPAIFRIPFNKFTKTILMESVFLDVVLPIFAVPAFGYLAGRGRLFTVEGASAINRFIFYVSLPALVFGLLANASLDRFEWGPLVGYMASELAVYLAGFVIARKAFGCDLREGLLIAMAGAFVNHVLFVLPIAVTLYGQEASLPIVAITTVDSILVFGSAIVAMEFLHEKERSFARVAKKITTNPMIIAMAGGIFVAVAGLDLPKGVNVYLDFAGKAAAPGALFALGIILSAQGPSRRPWLPVAISVLKLLVHPVLAWICIVSVFGADPILAKPSLMVAAGPCGTMPFVLALNYGVRLNSIARAILYTTVGSLATVSFVAAF